ncbi:MAG: M28 family peptidase [Catalinimonas sp.]
MLLPALLLFVTGCGGDKGGRPPALAKEPPPLVETPTFDADSAYAYVAAQVAFGPRVPNTAAHRACGDYLADQMRRFGWEVQEQVFVVDAWDGTPLNGRNIISTLNPDASKRILLMAHWDTRPYADQDDERQDEPIPGANDGGSGVAVLMEVARVMGMDSVPPNLGVDIIFTDAEDYGQPESDQEEQRDTWCLGAQHWARNPHRPGYGAYFGILLDMVGGEGARFYRDQISMEWAPSVVKRVWDTGHRLGYSAYFINQTAGGLLDEHYYINRIARIPMIDIIEHDPAQPQYFYRHWHTHNDDMESIGREPMRAVGETLLQVLYQEAQPAA